jgi:hypothetical protein
MKVSSVAAATQAIQVPTREEMVAIAAARPAVLQQQAAALAAVTRGTSGEGTPAIDANGGVDFYA